MRIAIKGMGRIGRMLFRRLINDPQFEIVAVNDLMDAANLAYLLKYASLSLKIFGNSHNIIMIECALDLHQPFLHCAEFNMRTQMTLCC